MRRHLVAAGVAGHRMHLLGEAVSNPTPASGPYRQKGPRWCPGAFGPASRILCRATGECVSSCSTSAPASARSSERCARSAQTESTAPNGEPNEASPATVASCEEPCGHARPVVSISARHGYEAPCPAVRPSPAPWQPGRPDRADRKHAWRSGRSAEAESSRPPCPVSCAPENVGSRPACSLAVSCRSAPVRARSSRESPARWHPPGR
jgi:hypothetical protein